MGVGAALLILALLFRRTWWLDGLVRAFTILVFPIEGSGWLTAVLLVIFSFSLKQRRRIAWWVCVAGFLVRWLITWGYVAALVIEVASGRPTDYVSDYCLAEYLFNVVSIGAILCLLIADRHDFVARVARRNFNRAVLVALVGVLVSLAAGWAMSSAAGVTDSPTSRLLTLLEHLTNIPGIVPVDATMPGWLFRIVSFLMAVAVVAALIVLMRSQHDIRFIDIDEELELRRLLAQNPADSLGYFSLRRDKAAIFSENRRAAICYRAELGVALASGDPIGPRGQWSGAISAFMDMAHSNGWTPAVLGTSEQGTLAWQRAGLRAVRIGDEAILSPQSFTLEAPEMKSVRTSVNRLRRAGYTTRVRRHDEIDPQELAHLIALADLWRRNGDERGFSMALSRLGDPLDGRSVMVEALYPVDGPMAGRTAALLSFVPWGPDGLSLDVMRRDLQKADNGVTELMVAGLMAAGREMGIHRVSLNFAVLREMIEQGDQVGALMVHRLNRRLVGTASRWFQIEQLYHSNVKYLPSWQPRYLVFPVTADLAQVGLAMGIAEGQLDIPRWLYRGVPPEQPIYRSEEHPEIAAFLSSRADAPSLPQRLLPEQMRVRMATRQHMLDAGVQPYPPDCTPDHAPGDVAHAAMGEQMSLSGRVVAARDHGGVVFCDMADWSGQCQVLLEEATLGARSMQRLRSQLSLGDHLVVSGTIGRSRNGTTSLLAEHWKVSAKSLRPLPNRRDGLTDPESKVRRRYLDLIVNPSSRDQLVARSRAIRAVRETLLSHDFLEVETPILQTIHGGANARPFRTHINAYDTDLYLRIAPELYLKRLMVGGVGRVFEIGRNFRNEGADATHNPEFTMLEAYQAYGDYAQMRELTAQMIRRAATAALGTTMVHGVDRQGMRHEFDLAAPWRVVTVNEALSQALGEEVSADTSRGQLVAHAKKLGIPVKPSASRGDVVLELHEHLSERTTVEPTFYCDFPTEVSPLTRQHRDDPRLAEKWDLIVLGSEVATAYTELVDPVIQRERFTAQSLRAAGGDPEAMELDEDFLEALEYAMPPSGGMGMGLDRLVMMLTGASIRETIAFPLVRPRRV